MNTRKVLVAVLALAMTAPMFQGCKKVSTKKLKGDWTVGMVDMSGVNNSAYTNNTNQTWKQDETMTHTFNGSAWSYTNEEKNTDNNGNVDLTVTEADASAGTLTNTSSYNGTQTSTSSGEYSSAATMAYSFDKEGGFTSATTDNTTEVYTSEPDSNLYYDPDFNFDYDTLITVVVTTEVTEATEDKAGEWSFIGKNKSADIKANERIALTYVSGARTDKTTTTSVTTYTLISDGVSTKTTTTTVEENDDSSTITYTTAGVDEIWKVTEISKDALKAELSIASQSEVSTSNSGTSTDTDNEGVKTSSSWSSTSDQTMTGTIELSQE